MMQEDLQQNTTPESVPWTIGDIVKGSLVAIAATIIIGIVMLIFLAMLVGMKDLQDIASQNLSSVELLKEMFNILKTKGSLNTGLIIMYIGQFIFQGAMPFAAWLFGVKKYRCKWKSLGFVKFDIKKGLLLAVIITGIGIGISIGFEALLKSLGREISTDIYSVLTPNNTGLALFAVAAIIVAPFVEETFFRGFMFQGIKKRIGFAWAAIISAALFATSHMSAESLIPIFFLGLLLAWLYHKTNSVWPCIIVHAANNSIAVISMIKS